LERLLGSQTRALATPIRFGLSLHRGRSFRQVGRSRQARLGRPARFLSLIDGFLAKAGEAATLCELLPLSGSLSPRFARRLKMLEGLIIMLEAAIVVVVTLTVMALLYRLLEPKT
jgi:hypothetical protein